MSIERKYLNGTKCSVELNDDCWSVIKSFLLGDSKDWGFLNGITIDTREYLEDDIPYTLNYFNTIEYYFKNIKTINNNQYLLIDRSKDNGVKHEHKDLDELFSYTLITPIKFRRSRINLYYDSLRNKYYFQYNKKRVYIHLKSCPIF